MHINNRINNNKKTIEYNNMLTRINLINTSSNFVVCV